MNPLQFFNSVRGKRIKKVRWKNTFFKPINLSLDGLTMIGNTYSLKDQSFMYVSEHKIKNQLKWVIIGESTIFDPCDTVKKEVKKCQCGAHAVRSEIHSVWCCMFKE